MNESNGMEWNGLNVIKSNELIEWNESNGMN